MCLGLQKEDVLSSIRILRIDGKKWLEKSHDFTGRTEDVKGIGYRRRKGKGLRTKYAVIRSIRFCLADEFHVATNSHSTDILDEAIKRDPVCTQSGVTALHFDGTTDTAERTRIRKLFSSPKSLDPITDYGWSRRCRYGSHCRL